MIEPWWRTVSGEELAQGDLIPGCEMPFFVTQLQTGATTDVEVVQATLIIVSQTCDLFNNKAQFVACCGVHTLDEFENQDSDYARKGRWEEVRKGREPSLHLLASPVDPDNNRKALVVDFGHIVSLPIQYLRGHAATCGARDRLVSPFLEHFSQSLARFFMRVGLPSSLPPFR